MRYPVRLFHNIDGIAMAETIIVLPFFIIVWLGMCALSNFYEARLAAQNMASLGALASASAGNCNDVSLSIEDLGVDAGEEMSGTESDVLSELAGIHPLAVVHVHSSASAEASYFGERREASGERLLLCNTKPVDGLMDLIVSSVKIMLGIEDD